MIPHVNCSSQDFDQSTIGNAVVQALEESSALGKITWSQVPSSNFADPNEVGNDVVEQKTWIAVVGMYK